MPTIEEVTRRYIELRDEKQAIAKRQSEELAPYNEKLANIEAWLMHQMNELKVDSLKNAAGTPYKSNQNSVRMDDAAAFKSEVFSPAVEAIHHYLCAVGHSLQPADIDAIKSVLIEKPRWDIVDFRVGKKGVLEYQEAHNVLPPGVSVETISVINVRRS